MVRQHARATALSHRRDPASHRTVLGIASGVKREEAKDLKGCAGIGMQRLANSHHSTPRIRQFNPLPMPQNATRWPGSSTPRSSAIAAVIGRLTVPMLPRYSNV